MSHNFSVPQLPVLDQLVQYGGQFSGWERIAFVCVQHLLPTTVSLFSSLIKLGARPDNIYILGKYYSTNNLAKEALVHQLGLSLVENSPQTKLGFFSDFFYKDVMNLWRCFLKDLSTKSIDSVIVIDEGGHCLATMPEKFASSHKVVGVEQTTAGLLKPYVVNNLQKLHIPLINVAQSAAKKWLEPFVISRSVIKKIFDIIPIENKNSVFGIVGLGAIGRAVADRLSELGYQPAVYDIRHEEQMKLENYSWKDNINQVVSSADIILGCSGQDISKEIETFASARLDRSLISCSSEDIEYNSLLRSIQETRQTTSATSVLQDAVYETRYNGHLRIHRGGFPINFDNLCELEPISEIQLTRGLLLGGILQAALTLKRSSRERNHTIYALDSSVQKAIAHIWALDQTQTIKLEQSLQLFENDKWIREHSQGEQDNSLNVNFNIP
jgi:S-adenosylhomocysteine hydrolase